MKKTTQEIMAINLQRLLDTAHMNQTDLAEKLEVTSAAVSLWVLGKSVPRASMVDKICKVFNISKEELLRDPDKASMNLAESKVIPLYNSNYHLHKFQDSESIERYMAVDNTVKADFGIIVSSDSMSDAGIVPGDIAFFKHNFKFISGRIYAVWIEGAESVILKRVYPQNNSYVLISENANIPPIVVENNKAIIVGELFGIYKEWRWE